MSTVTAALPFTVSTMGSEGEYVIVKHGFHPQLGRAYCYKDKKYDFYFYVQTKDEEPGTLSVWYTSSQLFAGGPPAIDPDDRNYVEQNIKHYLENVSVVSFEKIVPPTAVPTIVFAWVIRRW